MPRINNHHIKYKPEWVVELAALEHKAISVIQRSNASMDLYSRVTNFVHSLSEEWNRVRMELDTGLDCKELYRGKLVIKKRKLKIKKRKK